MKFSISFKYSNVTFKNKETKETVTYDSKAEGNTFTFDNVDEDIVLGIVKGIKDRKASQVFAYDDFRTNFINTMARNKCKELYDKLDKGDWKVEDVSISTITIKDLEFTKPTMNAREALTVESKNRRPRLNGIVYINWVWSSEYGDSEIGEEQIPVPDSSDETIKEAVLKFCNNKSEWDEVGGHCDNVYLEVFFTDYGTKVPEFLYDGSFAYGEIEWFDNNGKEEHKYKGKTYMKGITMNESKYGNGPWPTWVVKERLVKLINGVSKEHPMWSDLVEILKKYYGEAALEQMMGSKRMSESKEEVEVEFKKTPDDGTVIAFFPQTMHDGSCNPGNIMSYEHNGQHGEASIDYYHDCTNCFEEDYASLLHELEGIYDDCELVVVEK